MGGAISYSGPSFPDSALVTADQIRNGTTQVPPGSVAYVVQPGDNLTVIAQQNGYEDLQELYANNPQYSERNPDLIYPGEVVFVPDPNPAQDPQTHASEATQEHGERVANGEPGVSGSDQGLYNQAEQHASGLADATDENAAAWTESKQARDSHSERVANGEEGVNGSDQRLYNEATNIARDDFDEAAIAEIDLGSRTMAASNSPEDRAAAALEAGEGIAQRLEAQGNPEAAARVRDLAEQRAEAILEQG